MIPLRGKFAKAADGVFTWTKIGIKPFKYQTSYVFAAKGNCAFKEAKIHLGIEYLFGNFSFHSALLPFTGVIK